MAAPAPIEPSSKDPPPVLRGAGLVALLVLSAIDSLSPHYNPDSWVYLVSPLVIWGPGMLPGIGRKG